MLSLCAIFASGLLAESANASCGDYLHHAGMERLAPANELPDLAMQTRPVAPPCRGPHCRSQSPRPIAPTAPVQLDTLTERLLSRCERLQLPFEDAAAQALESRVATRPGFLPEIERPPQAG